MLETPFRRLMIFDQSLTKQLHKVICNRDSSYPYSYFIRKQFGSGSNKINIQFCNMSRNQRRYKSYAKSLVRFSAGSVIAFDMGSKESYDSMCLAYECIKQMDLPQKPSLLIGYVDDPVKRVISKSEIKEFAKKYQMVFEEVQKRETIQLILGKFIEQIQFSEDFNKIEDCYDILLDNTMDKTACSMAIQKISHLFNILRKKCIFLEQKREESAKREKLLQTEVQMLESQIQLFKMKQYQMEGKAKSYDKLMSKMSANDVSNLQEVLNLFEADNLRVQQQLKEMEQQLIKKERILRQRCQSIEGICGQLEGITIHNATSKIDKICEQYHKYKLNNCSEEGIINFQEKNSEISRMSYFLQGLNKSSVFEYT